MGLTYLSQPSPVSPDAYVLAGRELREGAHLRDTSRFADDVWRLSPALLQRQLAALILNFQVIPPPYRPTVKLLFYALLNTDPPAGELRLNIVTIHGRFQRVKDFFDWLQQHDHPRLDTLTPDHLLLFQQHLKDTVASPDGRAARRRSVRLFWTWREALDGDRLAFDPERLQDAWHESNSRTRRGENSTARIPEQVIGPLLVWSMRLVNDFADDILAARDEYIRLRRKVRPDPGGAYGHRREQLARLMDRYRAEKRPLPGGSRGRHGINLLHLAREGGFSREVVRQRGGWELIEQAYRDVGVDDATYLRTPIHGLLDGSPWLEKVPVPRWEHEQSRTQDESTWHDDDLSALICVLMAAAYCIVAYLSGMRDSEVKHLQRGCLKVESDRTGRISRRSITSMAFKGEGSPLGVEATWVVGEPVARAVEVLERLQPAQQQWLFAVPPGSQGYRTSRIANAKTTKGTNNDLNLLITWVNAYCHDHRRTDDIPEIAGRPWRLSTAQFRRTLAWFIGRRPGGSIAGAIQYRHLSVQMFEGYAGTSKAGFRAEAQQEALLARGEGLSLLVDRHEHEQLRGPSATEARTRLDRFGDRIRFLGKTPNDAQMKKLMQRDDPRIYPGRFVTCTDNPARRLCQLPEEADRTPSPGRCKPFTCRNVALTESNTRAWRERLNELDAQLTSADTLAPRVRVRLEEDREQTRAFLARVTALELPGASA